MPLSLSLSLSFSLSIAGSIFILIIIMILLYKNRISKNYKFANFLKFDITSDDKDLHRYVTKKWIEVYDQSEKIYSVNKEIRIKPPLLRSDLWDFSDGMSL